MHWHEHFIVDIALEEVESPPCGWCPILARGEEWNYGWFWLKFCFFLIGTPFLFAWQGRYSCQKFSNLAKNRAGPPSILFCKASEAKMWGWGDNWCSNWNQSILTCKQIEMKYGWGGRGQGSKSGFDSKGLIGSVTSHSGIRIFSNRFLKEAVK